jgi:hypothetical protein
MKKKSPEPNESKITRKVRYLPQIAVPWGRGSSEFRPGIFAKRYLVKHGEASASQVFSALKQTLSQMNQERVEIGEKAIRGCTYNSFAKYWHWFKILGLIERTRKSAPAIYDFLKRKRFYRITEKGRNEVRAWEDPILATHPEFRQRRSSTYKVSP